MKDKIRYILSSERLTTSRFAEMLGIQPSAVSHLVSGRNKPGYDLIQRILRQFPRVNPDWFLLDIGTPFRDEPMPTSQNDNTSPELFNPLRIEYNEYDVPQEENIAPLVSSPIYQKNERQSTTPSEIDLERKKEYATTPTSAQTQTPTVRPVRVMVFYEDGTCENFAVK